MCMDKRIDLENTVELHAISSKSNSIVTAILPLRVCACVSLSSSNARNVCTVCGDKQPRLLHYTVCRCRLSHHIALIYLNLNRYTRAHSSCRINGNTYFVFVYSVLLLLMFLCFCSTTTTTDDRIAISLQAILNANAIAFLTGTHDCTVNVILHFICLLMPPLMPSRCYF